MTDKELIDLASDSVKLVAKRWNVSPKDIMKKRNWNNSDPVCRAKADVMLDLLGNGCSKRHVAFIFGIEISTVYRTIESHIKLL